MVLTKAQVASIQSNWTAVETDLQAYGNKFFVRYLEANPGDVNFFPQFSSTPFSQLPYDVEFNKQSLHVFEYLTEIVKNLNDIEKCNSMLQEQARTHRPREITMGQFETLLGLMPSFLEDEAKATGATADAWREAIATLLPAMRAEYK